MFSRRSMLKKIAATGIGTAVFHRALVAQTEEKGELTVAEVKNAEWITGVELSDEDRDAVLGTVKQLQSQLVRLREVKLNHDVGPALHFRTLAPLPDPRTKIERNILPIANDDIKLPKTDEEIAFLPVTALSSLIGNKKITSTKLTQLYLGRLKKYGPMLRCVVNLTEDLAMKQAKRADEEIAAGTNRGPLHGIPWGAKDLISVPGYPTTWGIPVYKERQLSETATVAKRLEEAGAVLVAKLSLGAIAMGDMWFEGKTRNPWNPRIGSSGSSAGSASATIAGLVGFAIGSETLGSILSPSIRCGASGFRPTFGRVSRAGCMPLSWSMDKIGPICRSVEDCAIVFAAIHGADDLDMTAGNYPFAWPSKINLTGLKVGYSKPRRADAKTAELDVLKELGCELVEVEMPRDIPASVLPNIIDVEGASVMDDCLRDGETEGWNQWKSIFQGAQFISAIDYLRMQRVRTRLMHNFEKFISQVDVLVNVQEIYHTNLAGHPSVVIPRAYRDTKGARSPVPVVFTGHLNKDDQLLGLAHAFQQKVDAHRQAPELDSWLERFNDGTMDDEEKKGEGEPKSESPKQSPKKQNGK